MADNHLDTPKSREAIGDLARALLDLQHLTGTLLARRDADLPITEPMWDLMLQLTFHGYAATKKAGITFDLPLTLNDLLYDYCGSPQEKPAGIEKGE